MIKDPLRYYIAEGFACLMYCHVDKPIKGDENPIMYRLVIPDRTHNPVVTNVPGGNTCLTWGQDTYCMDKATVKRYGSEYSSPEEMERVGTLWHDDTKAITSIFRDIIQPVLNSDNESESDSN